MKAFKKACYMGSRDIRGTAGLDSSELRQIALVKAENMRDKFRDCYRNTRLI